MSSNQIEIRLEPGGPGAPAQVEAPPTPPPRKDRAAQLLRYLEACRRKEIVRPADPEKKRRRKARQAAQRRNRRRA